MVRYFYGVDKDVEQEELDIRNMDENFGYFTCDCCQRRKRYAHDVRGMKLCESCWLSFMPDVP